MHIRVFTLFPEFFTSPLSASLLGQACSQGRLSFSFAPLRDFGEGKYKSVDDRPFGGGAGMVMKTTVLESAFLHALGGSQDRLTALEDSVKKYRALTPAAQKTQSTEENTEEGLPFVLYMSPQGQLLTAAMGRQLAQQCDQPSTPNHKQELWILCGHYEGVDERFIEAFVHLEVSVGDYILTGGETAALVFAEVIARFIPGVVGTEASVDGDTFETQAQDMVPGGLKYPVYTRPATWRNRDVPEVLTSGHHGAVKKFRLEQSKLRTKARRPDLLKGNGVGKGGKP